MKDFASELTHVTYKEIMIFWNCSQRVAQVRLNTIRNMLEKKRFHRLTVIQFCIAEDISVDEFNQALNRFYNNQQKKIVNTGSLFTSHNFNLSTG
jgi:ribosome-interacting GTPase 1